PSLQSNCTAAIFQVGIGLSAYHSGSGSAVNVAHLANCSGGAESKKGGCRTAPSANKTFTTPGCRPPNGRSRPVYGASRGSSPRTVAKPPCAQGPFCHDVSLTIIV